MIVVFRMERAIVGYAIVIYHWSNEYGGDIAFVDELFVKPGWRGKGIGSSVLEHIAAAKTRVFKGVQLEVHPANEKAPAFYRSQGYSSLKNRSLFKKLAAQ
jgi:ribosomal protein S18 acetylase RimI-like enzyme